MQSTPKPLHSKVSQNTTPQYHTMPEMHASSPALRANTMAKISFSGHKLIDRFDVPNYKDVKGFVYELSNKHKVIIVPKPGMVAINTMVKTGCLNEKEEQKGIKHAIEHLLYCGSKGLAPNEISERAERKGAMINAMTSEYVTAFYFKVANPTNKSTDELIKNHAAMIQHPQIPTEQFEKEKEVVIKEINEYKDDPENAQINTTLKNLFGIQTKSKELTLGDEEGIRNLTMEEVLENHRQNYTPDNMVTVIVGDVKPQKAIEFVDKYFDTKDFQSKAAPAFYTPITPLQKTKVEIIKDNKIEIPKIMVGFAGPKNSDSKEEVAAEALVLLMAEHKSSRLNKNLSKFDTEAEGDFQTLSNHPKAPNFIYFQYDIKPGNEQKSLNAFTHTLKELQSKPVKQKELEMAKRNMLYKFKEESQGSEDLAIMIADYATIGFDKYKNRIALINSLTPEDIQNAAKHLDANKAAVVVLEPKKSKVQNFTFGSIKPIKAKYIKETKLANNVHLITNDNPYMLTSASQLILKTPVQSKTGTNVILAAMLENRTKNLSEQKLAKIKAQENINIEIEGTNSGIVLSTSSENDSLIPSIKLVKETLTNPDLSPKNFHKAKRELQMELDAELKQARNKAYEVMYSNHALGISLDTLKKEIKKVKLEDVQNYYHSMMTTSKAKASVTAPLSQTEHLEKQIHNEFSSIQTIFKPQVEIPNKDFKAPQKTQIPVQIEKGRTQSDIFQLFNVPTENIKDIAAMNVLSNVLDGNMFSTRLFSDLREDQKLCYGIGAKYEQESFNGQFSLFIQTDIKDEDKKQNNNLKKAVNSFQKHIELLKTTDPTKIEMERAKNMAQTVIFDNLENPELQNEALTKDFPMKEKGAMYYNHLLAEIEKVTPQDVKRVANEYLSKPCVISILTTNTAFKKHESYLKTQGEIKLFKED
jgi:zinc protease